jgi:hypothetical protein
MNTTKRLEKTIEALDTKQLKKALYLTDNEKTRRHHEIVEQAARICLAKKDDKTTCDRAIKEARDKIQETISLPVDDTSLEGLEEYLSPQKPQPEPQKSDEELYEDCMECHVATTVVKFGELCKAKPAEAGEACELISKKVEANAEPVEWLKTLIEITEQAKGEAKEEMQKSLSELTDYLEIKQSPWLKELDK